MDEFTKIRLGDLKRKLNARRGKREYRDNVKALEAEIAKIEQENNEA